MNRRVHIGNWYLQSNREQQTSQDHSSSSVWPYVSYVLWFDRTCAQRPFLSPLFFWKTSRFYGCRTVIAYWCRSILYVVTRYAMEGCGCRAAKSEWLWIQTVSHNSTDSAGGADRAQIGWQSLLSWWYHSNYPKEWFALSQIRGRVVALRDRIHREVGDTIDLIVIWLSYANSFNVNCSGEQDSCSADLGLMEGWFARLRVSI